MQLLKFVREREKSADILKNAQLFNESAYVATLISSLITHEIQIPSYNLPQLTWKKIIRIKCKMNTQTHPLEIQRVCGVEDNEKPRKLS